MEGGREGGDRSREVNSHNFLGLLSYKSRKHEKELYQASQNGLFLKKCKMRTKVEAASWPNTSDRSAMKFGRKLRHFPLNA